MSKTWFAVGPDVMGAAWFAYRAETKFDAIWQFYQDHGAPAPGSERINAVVVPEWHGKLKITQKDWSELFDACYKVIDCLVPMPSAEGNDFIIDLMARVYVEGELV